MPLHEIGLKANVYDAVESLVYNWPLLVTVCVVTVCVIVSEMWALKIRVNLKFTFSTHSISSILAHLDISYITWLRIKVQSTHASVFVMHQYGRIYLDHNF